MLSSAVSRQWAGFSGQRKWKGAFETAATLMFGLIMNHPFHDANKRTALISGSHQLLKNGIVLTLTEAQLEDFTVHIAEKIYLNSNLTKT